MKSHPEEASTSLILLMNPLVTSPNPRLLLLRGLLQSPPPSTGHTVTPPAAFGSPLLSPALQWDPSDSPHPGLPFWEITRVEGLVKLQVPLSLSEPSPIKRIGVLNLNSSTFIKEFQYTPQSCSLTFRGIDTILTTYPPRSTGKFGNKLAHMRMTVQAPLPPKAGEPLGSCFKYGHLDHWAQACPNHHTSSKTPRPCPK